MQHKDKWQYKSPLSSETSTQESTFQARHRVTLTANTQVCSPPYHASNRPARLLQTRCDSDANSAEGSIAFDSILHRERDPSPDSNRTSVALLATARAALSSSRVGSCSSWRLFTANTTRSANHSTTAKSCVRGARKAHTQLPNHVWNPHTSCKVDCSTSHQSWKLVWGALRSNGPYEPNAQ